MGLEQNVASILLGAFPRRRSVSRVSHLSVSITSLRVAGRASHPTRASSLAPRTSCGRTRRPMNARRVVTVAVMTTTKPRPHSPHPARVDGTVSRVRRLTGLAGALSAASGSKRERGEGLDGAGFGAVVEPPPRLRPYCLLPPCNQVPVPRTGQQPTEPSCSSQALDRGDPSAFLVAAIPPSRTLELHNRD